MEILHIDEIAEQLRVCRKTVYNYIDNRGLDKYISRVGGRLVSTPELLKQFVHDAILTKK